MTNRVNPINIEEKIDSGLLQISTNFLFDEIQNDNIKMIITDICNQKGIVISNAAILFTNSVILSIIFYFYL